MKMTALMASNNAAKQTSVIINTRFIGVDYLRDEIRNALSLLNAPVDRPAGGAMTRDGTKYSKSNLISSPTILPGIGINRAVSGLSSRNDNAATSNRMPASTSSLTLPGSGMQSNPVPQTALKSNKSLTLSTPSAPRRQRSVSSRTGNI